MLIRKLYFRSSNDGPRKTPCLITPADAKYLQSSGFSIQVEHGHSAIYSDQDYQLSGCLLVPLNSWSALEAEVVVIGSSLIPEEEFPLGQIHIAPFDQNEDKQSADALLKRFIIGNGKIFELSTFLGSSLEDYVSDNIVNDAKLPPIPGQEGGLKLSDCVVRRIIQLLVDEKSTLFINLSDLHDRLVDDYQKERSTRWSNISVEKREEMRVPFHAKVRVIFSSGDGIEAETKNISVSGVFINTDYSAKLMDKCQISLLWDYKGKNIPFMVSGEISRSTPEGLGVYFTDMDMDTFYFIKDLIKYSFPES